MPAEEGENAGYQAAAEKNKTGKYIGLFAVFPDTRHTDQLESVNDKEDAEDDTAGGDH